VIPSDDPKAWANYVRNSAGDDPVSIDFDPNAVYKAMTDDELAELVVGLKEQANELRTTIWKCEGELRDRLIANNAKRLQGDKYLVKSSIKREIVWDQDKINDASEIARRQSLTDLFNRAFPLTYSPKLRELNELLKFGGETAGAIEAAKLETREKVELAFEML
jgi:hypothetical protein